VAPHGRSHGTRHEGDAGVGPGSADADTAEGSAGEADPLAGAVAAALALAMAPAPDMTVGGASNATAAAASEAATAIVTAAGIGAAVEAGVTLAGGTTPDAETTADALAAQAEATVARPGAAPGEETAAATVVAATEVTGAAIPMTESTDVAVAAATTVSSDAAAAAATTVSSDAAAQATTTTAPAYVSATMDDAPSTGGAEAGIATETAPATAGEAPKAANVVADGTASVDAAHRPGKKDHGARVGKDAADVAPDGGAPPDAGQQAEIRVVRSVGNAEQGQHPGEGGNDDGPPPGMLKNTPNASATGIAHAADNSVVGRLRGDVTTAPDVAAPPQPAPAPPALEQVARAVIERVGQGGGEARIRLDPPDLGQVVIRVRIDGDHVRVEVRAERPEAMQLLRDHTVDLSSLLGGRGLDLSDVFVGMGRGGGQAFDGDRPWQNGRGADGEFAELLGIDGGDAVKQHIRLRETYNPDGAHVYRI